MSSYENRQRRVRMKGIVPSHSEAIARVSEPGDVAVVKRGALRSVVMRCPDGCGEAITVNLDPRTDKAWRLYHSRKGLTLFPSVWRDTGCQSHFILWNDVLYWVDVFDTDESDLPLERGLEDRVWSVLKPDALTGFVEIADALEEIPWAVLDACRRLVRAKRAVAGTGSMKTSFKRV
ncbi:MAG: DUF6527 family protein [Candidatus Acidiferrales bacterium]